MKARKPSPIAVAQKVGEAMRRGPNVPRLKNWGDLVDNLKKLKVTPGEAYRIVQEKLTSDNIRFNWKTNHNNGRSNVGRKENNIL